MNSNNRIAATLIPRDIVCLRNISINTLHKGDDDDDNDNNNNNNNVFKLDKGYKISDNFMGRTYNVHGEMRNAQKILLQEYCRSFFRLNTNLSVFTAEAYSNDCYIHFMTVCYFWLLAAT